MNYFSKTQAEGVRSEFAHLVGRACFFNDIKETAILKEIKVVATDTTIDADGDLQIGYSPLFCFDNDKRVRADLFAHFNLLRPIRAPYKGLDDDSCLYRPAV